MSTSSISPLRITDSLRVWLSSASLGASVWSALEALADRRCNVALLAVVGGLFAITAFALPSALLLRHRLPLRGDRASWLLTLLAVVAALGQLTMVLGLTPPPA